MTQTNELVRDVPFFSSIINNEINAKLWDAMMADHPKAVVLKTFGSGSVGKILIPKIRETVRAGIPVFLLSSMEGQEFGILKQVYQTNSELLDAGAVALESVNITNLQRANQHIIDTENGLQTSEYHGQPADNILKTISDIVHNGGDMFEWIQKVRETYNLSDEQIALVEKETHRLEPNIMPPEVRAGLSPVNAISPNTVSIPVTRKDILRSRRAVDIALQTLKGEISREKPDEKKSGIKLA